MGRRTRQRWIKSPPNNIYFKGPPLDDNVILTLAEFEAMRLKHYLNLNQNEAASKMGVSQPTFSRILDTAHQKMTSAIIEGKNIKVFGGNIQFVKVFNGYACLNCDNEWEDEDASIDGKANCPKCNSRKVYHLIKEPI